MKTLVSFVLLLAFVLCVFADNPYSVWCDYHNTYFYKKKQEYPSGKCYDVYSHTWYDWKTKENKTHTMSMKCDN